MSSPAEDVDGDIPRVGLAHGAGGKATRQLVGDVLAGEHVDAAGLTVGLDAMDDGAVIPVGDQHLVITTDSHVIQPAFFNGGDIGRLAISGTVNDLAMLGATDVLGMTSGVIVEANYPIADLERIAASMHEACAEADAPIVSGDTKVMGKGELDGVVINTTGVGIAEQITPDAQLEVDDVILVTGEVGSHGISLLAAREGIEFGADLRSDVRPINDLIASLIDACGADIHVLKDPTRMGVAGSLNEIARKSDVGIELREERIPVSSDVKGTGEMLGLDPLQIANEGIALVGVAPTAAAKALEVLRAHPKGDHAAAIGKAIDDHTGHVIVDTGIGRRFLREPASEPHPRIC